MSDELQAVRQLLGELVGWFRRKQSEEQRGVVGSKWTFGTVTQVGPLQIKLDGDTKSNPAQAIGPLPPLAARVLCVSNNKRVWALTTPVVPSDLGAGYVGQQVFDAADQATAQSALGVGPVLVYSGQGSFTSASGPDDYPTGITIFDVTDNTGTSWPAGYATIETVRFTTARTFQRLTVKGGGGGTSQSGDVWVRTGWDATTWQPWQHLYSSDRPASVSLASDYVLATSTGADVTGMSLTITARSASEVFRVDVACDTASNSSTSNGTAFMMINVDGTDNSQQLLLNNAGNANTRALLSRTYWVTGLTPGSHTVKLRGGCSTASGMKLRPNHTSMTITLDR